MAAALAALAMLKQKFRIMDFKNITHGVTEQETLDPHIENFQRKGFSVFKGLISKEKVAETRDRMHAIYKIQCDAVGGEDNLRKLNEAGIIRSMFAYDEFFIKENISNPTLQKYVSELLDGPFTLYSQVGVISEPNNKLYQIRWHREIQYQHFATSRPIAVQTLFILDHFNEKSGGTFLLPGSHLFDKFPSNKFVEENQYQPVLEPGDVILMNSMLYHRAGLNTSDNNRLLITNTYVRPFIATQFNYPAMIKNSDNLTEKEKEILGFRWNYSQEMQPWRNERLGIK